MGIFEYDMQLLTRLSILSPRVSVDQIEAIESAYAKLAKIRDAREDRANRLQKLELAYAKGEEITIEVK